MKNLVYISGVGYIPLQRDRLWRFMTYGVETTVCDSRGIVRRGLINSIQREDGSGHSFNVTLADGVTFHIRTVQ